MTRHRAALIHLSISAGVASAVVAVLILVWYPPPLFSASGADLLAMTIIGVDVVIGPLLTWIVFQPGKWGLKFDLWCIGIAQTIALGYGLYVMSISRPVFIVATIDRLVVVHAIELDAADLEAAPYAAGRRLSWLGPVLLAAERPADPKAAERLLFAALGGKDLQHFPQYYTALATQADVLRRHHIGPERLRDLDPDAARRLSEILDQPDCRDRCVVLPLEARQRAITAVVDLSGAKLRALIDLDPWPAIEATP